MPTSRLLRRSAALLSSYPALVVGVLLAAAVLPLHTVSSLAERIYTLERQLGLALVPAAAILLVAAIFHLQHRRHAAAMTLATGAASSRAMRAHALNLQLLIDFAARTSGALDRLSLRRIVEEDLPRLAGERDAWVVFRLQDRLDTIIHCHPASAELTVGEVERLALEAQLGAEGRRPGVVPRDDGTLDVDDHTCALLRVDRQTVGVIGLRRGGDAVSETERRLLSAAASLIGIAARNGELVRETREVGLRDGLTGCVNRTHGLEALGVELRRSLRSRAPLSIVLFDVDHFKAINDRHGHLCGDAVLASVGRVLHEQLRASDLKCRYGGEEFLILLPETPLAAAATVAESLRAAFERMLVTLGQEVIQFTASFGVAGMRPGDADANALVARADAAMYDAKRGGRNRVAMAPEPEPGPPPPLRVVRRPLQLRQPGRPTPIE
jgi:diguanylate cyclase (GGDEF)-like protein